MKESSIWQVIKTSTILVLCFFNYSSVEKFIIIYTICNIVLYMIYFILILLKVFQYERKLDEDKI